MVAHAYCHITSPSIINAPWFTCTVLFNGSDSSLSLSLPAFPGPLSRSLFIRAKAPPTFPFPISLSCYCLCLWVWVSEWVKWVSFNFNFKESKKSSLSLSLSLSKIDSDRAFYLLNSASITKTLSFSLLSFAFVHGCDLEPRAPFIYGEWS